MNEQKNNQPSLNPVESLERRNELLQDMIADLLKQLSEMPRACAGHCIRCLAAANISDN